MTEPVDDGVSEVAAEPIRSLSINVAALQGRYNVALQHLLNTHAAIAAGLALVDENAYLGFSPFFGAYPAENRQLSKDVAVLEAQQRELRSVFRDAIELTHFYLEECRQVGAFFRAWNSGRIRGADFNSIVGPERSRFHKLGLPDKFKRLREEFGVATEFESHVLSINRVRACLVHRLGRVGPEDVDANGELTVQWRVMELIAQNSDGDEIVIEKSGFRVEAGEELQIRITNRNRTFKLGDRISFEYRQITDTIFTLITMSIGLTRAVEEYRKQRGVVHVAAQPLAAGDAPQAARL